MKDAGSAAMMRLNMERTFALPKARIWELLSNNNRLNRALGLDPVHKGQAAPGAISRSMVSTAAKIWPMHWQEYPFEWEHEQWYEVFRDYSRGPMRTFRSGIKLDEQVDPSSGNPRTTVYLYSNVRPASKALLPVIRIIVKQSMIKTFTYIEKAIEAASSPLAAATASLPVMARNTPADRLKLAPSLAKVEKLGSNPALVLMLKTAIEEGGDEEIADIKPFVMADRWGASREDVLKLLLRATQSGILNMEWRLICPYCRVSESGAGTLAALPETYHCDWCGIDYDAVFDRYVELCFSVHPDIRPAVRSVYCIGSPAFSPHIQSQRLLTAGGTAEFTIPSSGTDWRVRVLRSNEKLALSILAEQSELPVTDKRAILEPFGWQDDNLAVRPGQTIQIFSSRPQDVMIVLERGDWNDQIATASYITLFPEFRALFASDVLAPGQQAGIQSLTVLFTDLCGSTAFYERVGDAEGYGFVRQMFEFMHENVRRHNGVIVKTIGDAVMAVFNNPGDGLRAALDIQREWEAPYEMDLRIGLHHGPAVTVGMNGRNDYFGRTVNLAARIQTQGRPGEIVLDAHVFAELAHHAAGKRQETFTAVLKGVDGPVDLIRLYKELA